MCKQHMNSRDGANNLQVVEINSRFADHCFNWNLSPLEIIQVNPKGRKIH